MSTHKRSAIRTTKRRAIPASLKQSSAKQPSQALTSRARGKKPKQANGGEPPFVPDFRLLIEHTPDIIALLTREGEIRYCSPAIQQVLGYQSQEVLGKNFSTFLHPEDAPVAEKTLQLIASTSGVARSFEFRCRHHNDSWRILEGNSMSHMGPRFTSEIVITFRDITEHHWVNEKIRQAKREWEQTIDALSDLVLLTDTSGTIRRCNRVASEALALPYLELIGRPLWDVLYRPTESAAALFRPQASAQTEREQQQEEIYLSRLEGWFAVVRHPVRLPASEALQGFAYILTNITERKRLEDMLRERVIQPHDVASNLRDFRKILSLSQRAFGEAFGGYSQRQINAYESSESEVPISLLLAIKNNGYSLDVVLGPSKGDKINRMTSHLVEGQKNRGAARQLLAALSRLLEQEQHTLDTLLQELGIPQPVNTMKAGSVLADILGYTSTLSEPAIEEEAQKTPTPPKHG